MTAQALFKRFEGLFPSLAGAVTHYAARKEKNTIVMDTTARIGLIFWYEGQRHWRLETLESAKEK